MRRRIAARLLESIVVTFIVATISFFAIRTAPGDPFSYERPLPPAMRDSLRAQFGFNRPIPEQYVRYLANVARGNFGWSFGKGAPVRDVIATALPRSMLLAGIALALSFVLGGVLGVLQAARGGWFDRLTSSVLIFLYSVPDFWAALVIMTVFTLWWRLLPSGGMVDMVLHDYMPAWTAFIDRVKHLVLPAVSLTVLSLAGVARYQRAAMLEVLPSDFIRTARAKGVSDRGVIWRHALRNALTPMVTIFGLMLPAFLGGAVFVERVFQWPGLGSLATDAVAGRDYDLVTATIVIGAIAVVIGNLIADLLHFAIDPRIRE
ncbi:MAG: ABC transporter permease [Gemmatimonadaceae bacterium]